jgi:hypothetical protein
MFMRVSKSISAICLTTTLVISTVSLADDTRLHGVFVNPTQSEQPIKVAIEEGAAQVNFLVRPIARSRLKKTNPNVTRVAISRSGDDITIQLGTSKPSTARPGGPTVKWSRDDEEFDLVLNWEGTTLGQSFAAPDGKRINRYTLSADGKTLSVDVTVISDRLKNPVKYSLVFTRETDR